MRKIIILISLVLVISFSLVSAESNESVYAQELIQKAEVCLEQITSLNIPSDRANSSLEDAKQLYSAQMALELRKRNSDYKLVNKAAIEVCSVKALALRADEELTAFIEAYNEAAKSANLSEMDSEYLDIRTSFKEERFEDTLVLIDKGYVSLSEIQSKQTALRLFYDVTTRTIKRFFIENWKKLAIITAIIIILLIIFWRALNRAIVTAKIRHLQAQKSSLNMLIKELQKQYFSAGKISETEFNVKLNTYKEMILDIERQIPLLEENLAKLGNKRYFQEIIGKRKPKGELMPKYRPEVREVKIENSKKNKKAHKHK